MRAAMDEDFARFVGARQQRLLRAAYLVCGDRHLAEDLLQGALIKMATRWDDLRLENPDAYIRTILYRDAVSSWRKRRREVVVDLPPDPGVAAHDDEVGLRLDLERGLAELTPKQRAVIVARFFDDRSVREAADALGVSEGTVKSQTYAALERLRAVLPDLVTTEEDR